MTGKAEADYGIKKYGLLDIIVTLFFLFTAAASIYLFRLDLFRTIDARDQEPVGTITIRYNVIQRRLDDRTIWDRLLVTSPVYSGDLIRAADLSAATINIDENQISLNENTLIRVERNKSGKVPLQIELKEGNLDVATSGESTGIMLNMMGRQVQTGPGSVLNAGIGEEGFVIQVNEGTAEVVVEGESRKLEGGMQIALDSNGTERIIPAVVVKSPAPGARYLKYSQAPLPVNFTWSRINLEAGESLRLEIAADRGFTRNQRVLRGLNDRAQASFEAGQWHWRLSYGSDILSKGQLTVTDAAGPELLSPVTNSVFRYYNDIPQLRFQWAEKPEASHYILEICETQDFAAPQISKQVTAASFIQSELGEGTWYWRVRPVFPSAYIESKSSDPNYVSAVSGYSRTSSFKIEHTGNPEAPAIEVPEPASSARIYTVKQGDTLINIAHALYGTASPWRLIVNANNIADPNVISTGQVLVIPVYGSGGGYYGTQAGASGAYARRYTVKQGDTLIKIAQELYGAASMWRAIFNANNIADPDVISTGQVLIIPER